VWWLVASGKKMKNLKKVFSRTTKRVERERFLLSERITSLKRSREKLKMIGELKDHFEELHPISNLNQVTSSPETEIRTFLTQYYGQEVLKEKEIEEELQKNLEILSLLGILPFSSKEVLPSEGIFLP
jgi:RecG-like helicase